MTYEKMGRVPKHRVNIRRMEIDDIAQVYRLGERLFTREHFPVLYRTWDPREVTDYFTSDPDYCLVAEAQGAVVGFVVGTIIEKEGTAWKRYGYLSWIGVDEAFHRGNLGRRLYRRLEASMRKDGVRMVMADTVAGNQQALAFLRAMGFSLRDQHLWLAKTLRRPATKAARPATPEA